MPFHRTLLLFKYLSIIIKTYYIRKRKKTPLKILRFNAIKFSMTLKNHFRIKYRIQLILK